MSVEACTVGVTPSEGLGLDLEREWTPADQAWADKQAAEHEAWARDQASDAASVAAWVRKMRRKHRRCTNCTDGMDGEPDGMGGSIGGRCTVCDGTGWVPKVKTHSGESAGTQGAQS